MLERILPRSPGKHGPSLEPSVSSGPVRTWLHRRWYLPHITCLTTEEGFALCFYNILEKGFLGMRVVDT